MGNQAATNTPAATAIAAATRDRRSIDAVEAGSMCLLYQGETPLGEVFLHVLRRRVRIVHEKVEDGARFQLMHGLAAEVASGYGSELRGGIRNGAPESGRGS